MWWNTFKAKPPLLFNQSVYKTRKFSLLLVCLIISIVQTTAKITFKKNPCELGVSSALEALKCFPRISSKKEINLDFKVFYNLSSIYYSGLIFHYFLHIGMYLSSCSTTPLFLHIHTFSIFSFHACAQGVLSKWYIPAFHLILPTLQNRLQMLTLSMESFQKAP